VPEGAIDANKKAGDRRYCHYPGSSPGGNLSVRLWPGGPDRDGPMDNGLFKFISESTTVAFECSFIAGAEDPGLARTGRNLTPW